MEPISSNIEPHAWNCWKLFVTGLLLIIAGILILLKPVASYLTVNFLLSTVLIFSGISNIFIGSVGGKKEKQGWTSTAGIFETLIGISLLALSFASKIALPLVLGFWVMFRGVYKMGTALDLKKRNMSGWGWILSGGMADLVLAFLVLYNPARGVISIRFLSATIFIVGGIFDLVLAIKKKYIKVTSSKCGEEYMIE
jgi:uncharacterized membrane protein HdeD (DUF308 family)